MSTTDRFSQVIIRWVGVFMRRSAHDFMQIMKEEGLSMAQVSTLMRLYYQNNCDVSSIGASMGVTNAAASQMVDRLVQLGLLTRTEDERDRRVKNIALTKKGRALIERTIDVRRRWIEELTGVLTHEDQESIIRAFDLLTEAAEKLGPAKPPES